MSACCVYGCKNRSGGKCRRITFHQFPKNRIRRRAWTIAIKRKNFTPSKTTKICSEHFAEECFDRSTKNVRLKPNAVPTIFKHYPESLQKLSSMTPITEFFTEDEITNDEGMAVNNDVTAVNADVITVDNYVRSVNSDVITKEAEDEEEVIDEDILSDSLSSDDESSSENEPPETEVIYVSEEMNDAEAPSKPPRIIKVIPNGDSGDVLPKDPKLDRDIMDALSAYTKFRGTSSIEELKGALVFLVVVQPLPDEDDIAIFLKEDGKLKTTDELEEIYENQKKEMKALRSRTFRYEQKIEKLEKIIWNFKNYKPTDDEDDNVSDEDISEEAIYEELRKSQKKENDNDGVCDIIGNTDFDVVGNIESKNVDENFDSVDDGNYHSAAANKNFDSAYVEDSSDSADDDDSIGSTDFDGHLDSSDIDDNLDSANVDESIDAADVDSNLHSVNVEDNINSTNIDYNLGSADVDGSVYSDDIDDTLDSDYDIDSHLDSDDDSNLDSDDDSNLNSAYVDTNHDFTNTDNNYDANINSNFGADTHDAR